MTRLAVRLSQLSVGWLGYASILGCQNEYPLDPTPCDYWCAATERPACGDIDPADCVALCEREYLPHCSVVFTEAYECMGKLSDADICSRQGFFAPEGFPCKDELNQYANCRSLRESRAE